MRNDLLLRAALGEPTDRVPVWMMRQAGRVLPQYRKIRAGVKDFKEFLAHPELTAEATLQPVSEWDVDAAIIFSDILVIPEAMGFPFEMVENTGPIFTKKINTINDIKALNIVSDETFINPTLETIRLVKKEITGQLPLIGFCGAPWTIFAYMLEGKSGKDFSRARRFLLDEPEAAQLLLEKITQSSIYYLKQQIKNGADIIQIFDTWAGILGYSLFKQYSFPYLQKLFLAIAEMEVPIIIFLRGCPYGIRSLSLLPKAVIGLDWMQIPAEARALAGPNLTLQGNLDPSLLYASEERIRSETLSMLKDFGSLHTIANLGHGLYPDIDKEKARIFVDTVKSFRF